MLLGEGGREKPRANFIPMPPNLLELPMRLAICYLVTPYYPGFWLVMVDDRSNVRHTRRPVEDIINFLHTNQ